VIFILFSIRFFLQKFGIYLGEEKKYGFNSTNFSFYGEKKSPNYYHYITKFEKEKEKS
jgi:hypothetical protein